MSFAQDSGYTPKTFDELMSAVREAYNLAMGTTYDEGTWVGTNGYKYWYACLQKVVENETKTAEIFAKLQEYIATTNARIQRPSTSLPGLMDSFAAQGYVASMKKPADADAGKVYICVDVDDGEDDYADTKLEICGFIRDYIAAGMVTQGSEVESLVLTNGQSFDFKYALPDRTPIILRLTITSSENQDTAIPSDVTIRQTLYDNMRERYRLGWDFEPQRYYTQVDAPWAATILLEWSDDDGANWHDEVFSAAYDDLFEFTLDDIEVLVDA